MHCTIFAILITFSFPHQTDTSRVSLRPLSLGCWVCPRLRHQKLPQAKAANQTTKPQLLSRSLPILSRPISPHRLVTKSKTIDTDTQSIRLSTSSHKCRNIALDRPFSPFREVLAPMYHAADLEGAVGPPSLPAA